MKKNQFLKESDVTAESVFFMKRRQVLKALGISATALSLPHAAHADLLSWFKGNDRPPAPAGKALEFSKPAAWQNNLPLTPADKVPVIITSMNSGWIKPIPPLMLVA